MGRTSRKNILLFFLKVKSRIITVSLVTKKWKRFIYFQTPTMKDHEPGWPIKPFLLLSHKKRSSGFSHNTLFIGKALISLKISKTQGLPSMNNLMNIYSQFPLYIHICVHMHIQEKICSKINVHMQLTHTSACIQAHIQLYIDIDNSQLSMGEFAEGRENGKVKRKKQRVKLI